jgi:hypothetical protein
MTSFRVTSRTYNTTQPSVQCKFGPLGATNIRTLNIARAGTGQGTYGPINKNSNSATIFASYAEFEAIWNFVFGASAANPLFLDVTYVDQADPQYADVTHVTPAGTVSQHVVLQAIQVEVSAISLTTNAIQQQLAHDLSLGVAELQKLSQLVRAGLVKLGVPESEFPAVARDVVYASPSEPPTAGTESEYPPRFHLPGNGESDGALRQ